ncbi:hypothetical protein [Caballeronia insecticola]|uniref:hypothetical protein n=1 Tax=Caballeronia insecticola TaxID=758793 RepID=UPI001183FEF8|nr:hypothetical protein [Caballeronia insecticola]
MATAVGASPLLPYLSPALADKCAQRLSNLRCFNERDYFDLQPDVRTAGADYAGHALLYGATEGRALFKRETVARALGEMVNGRARENLDQEACNGTSAARIASKIQCVNIYVSSRGNVFMNEIAADLAEDLRQVGVETKLLDETADMSTCVAPSLFIAPHEFFTLGRGVEWLRDEVLKHAIVYNTEQIQTPWFSRGIPAMLGASGIIDISPQTAQLFKDAGARAMHWEPGIERRKPSFSQTDLLHPLMRVLPKAARDVARTFDDWADRPLDISFFGTDSPRRDSVFGRHAGRFADYSTCIYFRRQSLGPLDGNSADGALTRIAEHVSRCSKISLNIHRDEFSYFEWHRMVRQGMAHGSLVVTDPCLPHPYLKPGVHFFQEEPRHIPNLIDWILGSADGQSKASEVVANATSLIFDSRFRDEHTRVALAFIADHSSKKEK